MNEPHFPPSFDLDPVAPHLPQNPNWIGELRLTLFETQHFSSYEALIPPSAYQQYKA